MSRFPLWLHLAITRLVIRWRRKRCEWRGTHRLVLHPPQIVKNPVDGLYYRMQDSHCPACGTGRMDTTQCIP